MTLSGLAMPLRPSAPPPPRCTADVAAGVAITSDTRTLSDGAGLPSHSRTAVVSLAPEGASHLPPPPSCGVSPVGGGRTLILQRSIENFGLAENCV